MASIYDLKPLFQKLLRPLVAPLVRMGFTPNIITLIALIGSMSFVVIIGFASDRRACLAFLPVWLLVRMALNALDGMIARKYRMESIRGAALNEVGDQLSDMALYLPLAFLRRSALWPIIAFVFGAVVSEFCGLMGQALVGRRNYDGPMGKSDRALFIGLLALLTLLAPRILYAWQWIFMLAASFTLLTCWNRFSHVSKEIALNQPDGGVYESRSIF